MVTGASMWMSLGRAPYLRYRRVGNVVYLHALYNLENGSSWTLDLGPGFRTNEQYNFRIRESSGDTYALIVNDRNPYGNPRYSSVISVNQYGNETSFELSYVSDDDWPTNPPGTLVSVATPPSGDWLTRGIGSPEGFVTAGVGVEYVDTAKTAGALRWVKTTEGGNTGWKVTEGDTGWRDVTAEMVASFGAAHLAMRSGDKFLIRRINQTVYYNSGAFQISDSGWHASWPFPFTASFAPNMGTPLGHYDESLRPRTDGYPRMSVFDQGDASTIMNYEQMQASGWHVLIGEYPTDRRWPTTLPGVAHTY